MMAKLAKVGLVPGEDFDASKLDPAVAKGLAGAPKPAQEKIMAWMQAGIVSRAATTDCARRAATGRSVLHSTVCLSGPSCGWNSSFNTSFIRMSVNSSTL